MNAWWKWGLGSFALVTVAVLTTLWIVQLDAEGDVPVGPRYKEVRPERGNLRIAVQADGLVKPIDRIELKSKASGKVVELPIEVGDSIAKGDLLAKLDQVEERAALAQLRADLDIAQAELHLAEKNYARRQQLFSNNVISQEAQDQTELDLAVARSRLVQATTGLGRAKERMEDTVISSPVDGIILQKYVERGQIIASGVSNVGGGTPIVDVADMRTVNIEAGIDEIDIGKIRVGQRASIRAEAYADQRYEGVVVRISPEALVEQNVTLFYVIVEVENTDGNLRSGMNASLEIEILDKPDVLMVPLSALQRSEAGDAPSVLLQRGDEYVPHEVKTGITDQRVIEIEQGLDESDVIGIPMASRLKEYHDRMDARMRESRSFGKSGSSSRSRS